MYTTIGELTGYAIGAADGDIGSVDDFLFDDEFWTIRYIVADTAKWLAGRRVLISPIAVRGIDANGKRLPVSLTKQQVENSPDLNSRDLTRGDEISYYDYYGWPYYWVGGQVWGSGLYPQHLPAEKKIAMDAAEQTFEQPTLRSAADVAGYSIEATDGEIGHVDDYVIDDETWEIRYLIIDTKNWWPGKKVLVSPQWIERVSWSDSRVYVDLSREAIHSGPEFDPNHLDRDYEEKLHRHYERPRHREL